MCIVLLKHWLTNNMKKFKCLRKNTTYILVWSCAINIWYPHQHVCYAAFYLFFILLYTAGTALNFIVLVTMTITIFWFWKCIKTNEHGFVYSLALACSPPSIWASHSMAGNKHHQICLWRKVQSNNFREFLFRGATCEISQLQTSVGGHYSMQF